MAGGLCNGNSDMRQSGGKRLYRKDLRRGAERNVIIDRRLASSTARNDDAGKAVAKTLRPKDVHA